MVLSGVASSMVRNGVNDSAPACHERDYWLLQESVLEFDTSVRGGALDDCDGQFFRGVVDDWREFACRYSQTSYDETDTRRSE
jgi:hypothetical protein